MDFWKDIFEYDLQAEIYTAADRTEFDFDSSGVGISEVFAINENGDFVCAGDDFAEYISKKRGAGTWLQ